MTGIYSDLFANRALDVSVQTFLRREKRQRKEKARPCRHHPIIDARTNKQTRNVHKHRQQKYLQNSVASCRPTVRARVLHIFKSPIHETSQHDPKNAKDSEAHYKLIRWHFVLIRILMKRFFFEMFFEKTMNLFFAKFACS